MVNTDRTQTDYLPSDTSTEMVFLDVEQIMKLAASSDMSERLPHRRQTKRRRQNRHDQPLDSPHPAPETHLKAGPAWSDEPGLGELPPPPKIPGNRSIAHVRSRRPH